MPPVSDDTVDPKIVPDPLRPSRFHRVAHHTRGHDRTLLVFGAIVLISFASMAVMARDHALAKIQLATVPVTEHVTAAQLAQTVSSQSKELQIRVRQGVDVSTFSLADAGVTVEVERSVKAAIAAKRADSWWHNMQWWQDQTVPLTYRMDASTYRTFLNTHLTHTITPYVNATVEVGEGATVSVRPAAAGAAMSVPHFKDVLEHDINKLQDITVTRSKIKTNPVVPTRAAEVSAAKVKEILTQDYSFNFEGTILQPSRTEVASWLEIAPSEEKRTVAVAVNTGKISRYIDEQTAGYAYTAQTGVTVVKDGVETVLFAGRSGRAPTNSAQAAADMAKNLESATGKTVTLEVDHAQPKMVTTTAADRWLLVDLTKKRLYALEGTQIIQTLPVSAGAPATPTVTGKFAIYRKLAVQDMRGANADGTDYFQPNVEWVNYFYRDYAVHGNYWRPLSYFGNVNSSHGCVGLTNDVAKWVYDWTSIGTPVVVYQ